ncbi:ROK family protein [Lentisphaera profundi]|uniref:ROK family protein n=1 Tax=Lentisphaera profundi TaxID=1658616 RepID=A0ABY7VS90_9BACT|nr:ROK family protein [Lentisphaera profundi]WDE95757.1 ROK family protein [Lentisphaera profundi]
MNARISDKKIVANAVKILNEIHLRGARTQVELARVTHLKRTSIFNLFEVIKNHALVKVSDMITPAKGRPSVLWEVDGKGGVFLSVYFNKSENCYSFYDYKGSLIEEKKETSCATIEECLVQLETLVKSRKLSGLIVSISGIINSKAGSVVESSSWGLESYPLVEKLKEIETLKDVLIMIENNARAALWGERVLGKAQNTDDVMSLFIEVEPNQDIKSIGLGSALILGERLYQGVSGQAGELEHYYYDFLKKQGQNQSAKDYSELESFAVDLAQKFAKLVNYLVPQKLIVQFEGEALEENFYKVFSAEINKQKAFKYAKIDVLISDHHEELIVGGAVALLMDNYFDSSPYFIDFLEECLLS